MLSVQEVNSLCPWWTLNDICCMNVVDSTDPSVHSNILKTKRKAGFFFWFGVKLNICFLFCPFYANSPTNPNSSGLFYTLSWMTPFTLVSRLRVLQEEDRAMATYYTVNLKHWYFRFYLATAVGIMRLNVLKKYSFINNKKQACCAGCSIRPSTD